MKRITYWLLSTISAVVLLVGFDASRHGGSPLPPSSFVSSGTSGSTSTGSTSGSTSGSGSGSGSASGSGSSGQNGSHRHASHSAGPSTVTGSAVNTMWGPVQVQIAVNGASITQVKVLQYPNGNSRDLQIANYALPVLIQETMKDQSAHIDMVSGATYTSTGYIQSLQSAIDQANL